MLVKQLSAALRALIREGGEELRPLVADAPRAALEGLDDPQRLSFLLRRLGRGWPELGEAAAKASARLAPIARVMVSRQYWTPHAFAVLTDEARTIRVALGDGARGLGELHCNACGFGRCAHKLAVLLALCAGNPDARPWLTRPLWELQLLPHVTFPEDRPTRPQATLREGWLRYLIRWPPPDLALRRKKQRGEAIPDFGEVLQRLVMRRGKDGQLLKPRPLGKQAGVESLEGRIDGLTPRDYLIDRELQRVRSLLTALKGGVRGKMREDTAWQASSALSEAISCLVGDPEAPTDVWLDEARVTVMPEALSPTLLAEPTANGALALSIEPAVARYLPIGAGFLLDREGRLHRLAPDLPPGATALLTEPLAPVPEEDVARFLERFASVSPLPMRLATETAPNVTRAERVECRLVLSEQGSALRIEPRVAYTAAGGIFELDPQDGAPLMHLRLPAGGAALVRREPAREGPALAALDAALPRPWPAALQGDAAYDFLLETLPRLAEAGWTPFGDQALRAFKVRGELTPSISVHSEQDWFDLKVVFQAGDQEISLAPVLSSWRRGDRWQRLPDKSLARLPERWLLRHGDTCGELADLRRAGGGKLGLFAAPLARDLFDLAAPTDQLVQLRTVAQALVTFDGVADREPPAALALPLREYQLHGFRWLAFLRDARLGGILGDDMGLGKTVQALALVADTHLRGKPAPGPSLVVSPASVLHNWEKEAARFVPALRVYVHHGPTRAEAPPDDVDLILTTYATMRLDVERLRPLRLTHLVFDEAQALKNARSKVARAARQLDARHRLALSGTPLENHLYELYGVFQAIMPGFFGSREAFAKRWVVPISRGGRPAVLEAFRRRIRPFVLRRKKREVAPELPPRQEVTLYCELTPAERLIYDRVRDSYREAVLAVARTDGLHRAHIHVLEALTRLRQAACEPRLLPFAEARPAGPSSKLELLLETLLETAEEGHRTLVFSQWPSLLRLVRAELDAHGLEHLYLDGSTPTGRRRDLVERWQDPEGPPAFLISLKAGGTGLNLTGADHVIHVDPWWNPAAEDQATDRAHRIGQDRAVVAYKLVAKDTLEEKILELQARKRQLFEATLDTERLVVDQLTREDLEAIFD